MFVYKMNTLHCTVPLCVQAEKDDWFLGVKKLAGALYRNDLDRKGNKFTVVLPI